MQTVFRVAYSLAVAILVVLFVILGTRTFYEEPEEPPYPSLPYPQVKPMGGQELYCDFDGRCFKAGSEVTEDEPTLSDDERRYVAEFRRFGQLRNAYEDDRVEYHRNVFIIAAILGVAVVAAGLALYRRVEAMPLGLLLGGIGVIIFAWVQAAEDFDEIGMAPLFVAVAAGLAVVLAAGYWLLAIPRADAGDDRPSA